MIVLMIFISNGLTGKMLPYQSSSVKIIRKEKLKGLKQHNKKANTLVTTKKITELRPSNKSECRGAAFFGSCMASRFHPQEVEEIVQGAQTMGRWPQFRLLLLLVDAWRSS
ncbi:hypothetical protein Droror1_Dr00021507 [Drosera rotundifolia]